MNLQRLCTTPHVHIYFDSWNRWLYVEWEGDLTLHDVQLACLELARCYLAHAYPRILNSNLNVTSFAENVPAWLASEFIPALGLAGVQQLAWVGGPALASRALLQAAFRQVPEVAITLFDELELAATWLQPHPPTPEAAWWPRPFADEGKLAYLVERFAQWLEGEAGELPQAADWGISPTLD